MFFYSLSHTSDFRDFLNAWVFGVMRNQGFLENQYLIIVYSKTFVTIFVNKKARLQEHHDILKNKFTKRVLLNISYKDELIFSITSYGLNLIGMTAKNNINILTVIMYFKNRIGITHFL